MAERLEIVFPFPNVVMFRGALFELGRVVITRGATELSQKYNLNPFTLLVRHARGDHGLLDDEDVMQNERGLSNPMLMILSNYPLTPEASRYDGDRLWVITDGGRAVTTILLPSEY